MSNETLAKSLTINMVDALKWAISRPMARRANQYNTGALFINNAVTARALLTRGLIRKLDVLENEYGSCSGDYVITGLGLEVLNILGFHGFFEAWSSEIEADMPTSRFAPTEPVKSPRAETRAYWLECKRLTDFFFDKAMTEPAKHHWLARYSYWRDKETAAHKVYLRHMFNGI